MSLITKPPSRLLSISDGDTPGVTMGVRHLDAKPLAPEAHTQIEREYRVFVR